MTTQIFDPLALCLIRVAKDYEVSITQEGLLSGLPLPNGLLIPNFVSRAADRVSLSSNMVQQGLTQLNHFVFPAILLLKNNTACVLYRIDHEQQLATVYFPESADTVKQIPIAELQEQYVGSVIYLQQRQFIVDNKLKMEKNQQHWFWRVIREHRSIYKDILLGALFINIFALCSPFFVMNVYDRVVPSQSIPTLWVLFSGVILTDPQKILSSNPADLNDIMLDMVSIGERHGIHFPRDFALLFKQMLYFDRFMRVLAPYVDIYADQRLKMVQDVDVPLLKH